MDHVIYEIEMSTMFDGWDDDVLRANSAGLTLKGIPVDSMTFTAQISGPPMKVLTFLLENEYFHLWLPETGAPHFDLERFNLVLSTGIYSSTQTGFRFNPEIDL